MNRNWHRALFVAFSAASLIFPAAAHCATVEIVSSEVIPAPAPPAQGVQPGKPLSVDDFLKWDAETKEAIATNDVIETQFSFWLTNVSTFDVTINGVGTSCGCTAARLPSQPWTLPPGSNGVINVTMNLANKSGTITKTVTVSTDKGSKMLFVRSIILPPAAGQMTGNERQSNQMIALADRQAVFRGDCARCHADTRDKLGKELYASVCGVCHEAEHRASMVPNLRELKQPTNAEYWRNWITKGKPGTLMPAFSEKEGGILNDAQIESLVKYLTEAIPSKPAQAASATPAQTAIPRPQPAH
jgi:Cytochrome c, mono- and diheme variants